MAVITVTLEGGSKLANRLQRIAHEGPTAIGNVLYRTAEEVVTAAKRLTPVDRGHLRASGHVQPNTRAAMRHGDQLTVFAGFGGPAGAGNQGQSNSKAVGYAVYVHEDLTTFHRVGQAKYLEIPARAALQTIPSQMVAALNRASQGLAQRFAKGESVSIGLG